MSTDDRSAELADQYEVVYRATRDAIWHVVGTLALAFFYGLAGLLGLSLFVRALSGFVTGSAGVAVALVGVFGAAMLVVAGYRLYRL